MCKKREIRENLPFSILKAYVRPVGLRQFNINRYASYAIFTNFVL